MTDICVPRIAGNKVLLIGRPSCGKTTVMDKLLHRLAGWRAAGFLTLEIREHGNRVGFEAVGLGGHRAILAEVRSRSRLRVGRYGVDVEALNSLVAEELERSTDQVDTFLVDEIGKMECMSPKFVHAMRRILDGPAPVIATIALKGSGFIAEVKVRSDVSLIEVTTENRNVLPEHLASWLASVRQQ
jgi:nucleoside-triphosphatase